MKTKLILGSLIALGSITIAQNSNPWPTSGNVGIGTSSPGYKLDVVLPVGAGDGGIRIKHNDNYSSHVNYLTSGAGSGNFMVGATGIGNAEGNGRFVIHDANVSITRFLVGPNGNIGIGTGFNTPANSRLQTEVTYTDIQSVNVPRSSGAFYTYATQWGTYIGAQGNVNNTFTGGPISLNYGLVGNATAVIGSDNRTTGVSGTGSGGNINEGGHFEAIGNNNPLNTGVFATASGAANSWNDWAGYFQGKVDITGDLYNNLTYIFSDNRFKQNVKPLQSVSEKISKLNGYTYNYKVDEFKDKHFDSKIHIGLMAQEIKEVFPELLSEDDKGYYAVNYDGMIPVLLEALKEQIKAGEEQKKLLSSVQNQLDEQKQLISELKSGTTTGINNLNNVETGFQMSQNVPNPFTNETVVKYTLPETVLNAFMAVYDLTGKQITTFAINQKGSSSLTLTSEKLAAGIYIYSIVADGKVIDSKRMIVAEK